MRLDGRLDGTRRRLALATIGLVGTVGLVWVGPYPVSMVGLDDAVVNNTYPTRVTLGLLGLLQAGLVLSVEPLLARWLRRPGLWAATVLVNTRIMTIYLGPTLVFIGWWWGAIWLAIAWLMGLLLITLPISILMIDRSPAMVSLQRH